MLRYFPIALHLRLFGAAGIGYVVGNFGSGSGNLHMAIVVASGVTSIAGWWMMRSLMRAAREDIAAANAQADARREK